MFRLLLRLLLVIFAAYAVGSVYPLFATVGGHGTPSTPPPAPPPAAPPPAPVGPPASPTQLGGPSATPAGPPTLGTGGGGGCGGGISSTSSTTTASAPPTDEIYSTEKGPVTIAGGSDTVKGPPLPPPPGSDVKDKGGDKRTETQQKNLDKMTTELGESLKSGTVSDEQLTQQVNRITMYKSLNPNLKLSPEFKSNLTAYKENLQTQRKLDRAEYEIYHNTIIKLDNAIQKGKKDALTDITGAMVGELSKLNVGYGVLGIPITAAEQARRAKNAETIANDFKKIKDLAEARRKAEYLRESMNLRVRSIDKRLKILEPLLK